MFMRFISWQMSNSSSCSGESVRLSKALEQLFAPHKLNVAALGNMVRQLHIHHIVRFEDDASFPRPVWGVGDAVPYEAEALNETVNGLQIALDLL
jgi:diadenosine tetraphosphate (Ap4A) HIT family hydrolase